MEKRGAAIHLLVVEDSPEDLETYERFLAADSSHHYAITASATGGAGLMQFAERDYDCVLLDYNLPDMDGFEVLTALTEPSGRLPVPVVMLTGDGDEKIAVQAMKRGVQDYLPKNQVTSKSLKDAIQDAVEQFSFRQESEKNRHKLEVMALHDSVTGLGNRHLFENRLEHSISVARRNQQKLCLALLDLNHFKKINDTFGHHVGDAALRVVGKRLQATLRDADTIARIGGDEFVVLSESGVNEDGVNRMARKIVECLAEPITIPEGMLEVSCSVGLAIFPNHGNSLGTLLSSADAAMYEAKAKGGGYSLFEAGVTKRLSKLSAVV